MKKIITAIFTLAALVAFINVFSAFAAIQYENTNRSLEYLREQVVEEEASEIQLASEYDLSRLGTWTDALYGACRMQVGWKVGEDTVKTEDGILWSLNTYAIDDSDLLLIWFDDMGTFELDDDQIVKVWRAVYN